MMKYHCPVCALHVQMVCAHVRECDIMDATLENVVKQIETDLGIEWKNGNYWPLTENGKAVKKAAESL